MKDPTAKYPVLAVFDEEGDWVVEHLDLPGCVSHGPTLEEAVKNLAEVRELWMEGQEVVPPPTDIDSFSGKTLLRIPRSLHRRLHYRALQERVSLNQLMLAFLAEGISSLRISKGGVMAEKELVHETWERIMGYKWPGGESEAVVGMLRLFDIRFQPGTAEANLALQRVMLLVKATHSV